MSEAIKRISKSVTLIGLALLLVLGTVFIGGCTKESPTAAPPDGTSMVEDYSELSPLVEFVGEDNLSVLNLVGFKAANRAMKELGFGRGDTSVLALTDAGWLRDFATYKWWYVRLKMDIAEMHYLNNPEALVFTIKEFTVNNQAEIDKLKAAGDSLVELGIMPKP